MRLVGRLPLTVEGGRQDTGGAQSLVRRLGAVVAMSAACLATADHPGARLRLRVSCWIVPALSLGLGVRNEALGVNRLQDSGMVLTPTCASFHFPWTS